MAADARRSWGVPVSSGSSCRRGSRRTAGRRARGRRPDTGSAANLDHVAGDLGVGQLDIRDRRRLARRRSTTSGPRPWCSTWRRGSTCGLDGRSGRRRVGERPGSINVFAAAAESGYGGGEHLDRRRALRRGGLIPTPETARLPVSAYGLSKRAVEQYAGWFRRCRGSTSVPCATATSTARARIRPVTPGSSPIFCERALHGGAADDLRRRLQTRDFVFVARRCGGEPARGRLNVAAHRVQHRHRGRGRPPRVGRGGAGGRGRRRRGRSGRCSAPARAGEVRRSCLDVATGRFAGSSRSAVRRPLVGRACTGHSSGSLLRVEPAPIFSWGGTGPCPAVRPAARALARRAQPGHASSSATRGDRRLRARRGAAHCACRGPASRPRWSISGRRGGARSTRRCSGTRPGGGAVPGGGCPAHQAPVGWCRGARADCPGRLRTAVCRPLIDAPSSRPRRSGSRGGLQTTSEYSGPFRRGSGQLKFAEALGANFAYARGPCPVPADDRVRRLACRPAGWKIARSLPDPPLLTATAPGGRCTGALAGVLSAPGREEWC